MPVSILRQLKVHPYELSFLYQAVKEGYGEEEISDSLANGIKAHISEYGIKALEQIQYGLPKLELVFRELSDETRQKLRILNTEGLNKYMRVLKEEQERLERRLAPIEAELLSKKHLIETG